jgi:hypothetical protein
MLLAFVCFRAASDETELLTPHHPAVHDPKRTLMLQNHLWECSLSVCSLATIRCPILTVRDDDQAARVHHASQLRGGDLAAHSPRAAARAYAARRHPPWTIGPNMQIDTHWAQA